MTTPDNYYFKVRTGFETVDSRRQKIYQKICRLEVTVPKIPAVEGIEVPDSPQHILLEEVRSRLGLKFALEGYWERNTSWYVWTTVALTADKPSLIAADETARSHLPPDVQIISNIQTAHGAAVVRYDRLVAEARRDKATALLLSEFLSDMEKKAREVTRFKQRLAALTAELQAETAIQAQAGKDKFIDEVREQKAEDPKVAELISEESLGWFAGSALDYVAKYMGNGLPRGLGHRHGQETALEYLRDRSRKK